MKVTVNVKLVNSKFDQAYADQENEGLETEDNIHYLWEDEFEVQGDVTGFKVVNNTTYLLQGLYPNDDEFCFEIPEMTVVQCTMADGSITLMPFSKKAILKTEKVEEAGKLFFNVQLKSSKEVLNPMTGVYILRADYPEELLKLYHDEEE